MPKATEKQMSDNKTTLQQALDFKQKYEALIGKAKDEAIDSINQQIETLRELGFRYVLVPEDEPRAAAPRAQRATGTRTKDPNKPCSVCGFVTVPPHDGRVHRSQGDNKKPFTDAQLAGLGLKRA
jgi:hypothetical protein